MKLFASDYDGTYCKHTKQGKKAIVHNVNKTKEWRENGHIFAFCTGRAIGLMTQEIKSHGLEYDYIIGLNGGIIVDSQQNVLFQKTISNQIALDIIERIKVEKIPQYCITDGFNGYFTSKFNLTDFEWVLIIGLKWILRRFNLTEKQALENLVVQIAVKTKGHEEAIHFAKKINETFGEYVTAFPNLVHVDICAKGCSKATGVEFVANLTNIQEENVYCIGDSHNDVPMIEKYNGFTMIEAVEIIKEKSDYIVETVADAIDKIMSS
ncbi:MAG TPA: hypothetical protein DCY20_02305 [Firmicutes bacterium]|nr:hypothetical protein [Bacillota bacterium]